MKFYIFCVYSFLFCCCGGQNGRVKESEMLNSLLKGYDTRVAPETYNASYGIYEPSTIRVNMFVRSMDELNEMKGTLSMQLTFRMQWKDQRLSYSSNGIKYLSLRDISKVWIPDIFFANEKEANFHNILLPNTLLRIYPNGDVLFSQRITVNVYCPMVFRYYPNDIQECGLRLASYSSTTERLILLWKESNPIQITKQLFLPKYVLTQYNTDYCTSKTTTGEYSCLILKFVFKSDASSYWQRIYVPCGLLLLISFVSLFLSHQRFIFRFSLSLSSFAILFTKLYLTTNQLPNLSYSTSHDYWCLYSTLLSLFVILETIIVSSFEANKSNVELPNGAIDPRNAANKENIFQRYSMLKNDTPRLIDLFSIIAFFLAFCVIYSVSF